MKELDGKKLTVWGDSILKGVILDENDGKYKVMKNNCLNSFARITGCTVNNNAYFGMTSTKALNRISTAINRQPFDKNDIVIIEFGGNDCDYNWSQVSNDPEGYHEPRTSITSFKNSLQHIIDVFKEKGITPILMNLPPLEPEQYFNWVSKGLNKDNILRWLGDVAKIYRWQEAYNNAAEWIAYKNNCAILNVRESFLVTKNYSSHFCADGIHPNEKGHEKILESLLSFSF